MRKAAAVLLLALSLLTVVSPNHGEEMVRLCGDDFYDECKRLTEESSPYRRRRDLMDSEEDSADSGKEVRTVRSSPAKRHLDNFMPLALGLVKQTCCEVGCSERFMRYTCR